MANPTIRCPKCKTAIPVPADVAASAMGSTSTPAKQKAARVNGKKGGRPIQVRKYRRYRKVGVYEDVETPRG